MPGFNIAPYGGGYSNNGPSNTLETRRKHRWVFETIGRGPGVFSQAELLILQSAARPSITFEQPEISSILFAVVADRGQVSEFLPS